MPTRVHTILVATTGDIADQRVLRTLEAVVTQTTHPEAITLVTRGSSASLRQSELVRDRVTTIMEAPPGVSFADAVILGSARVVDGQAVWLLADGVVPAQDALAHLVGALERSPSAFLSAPKLRDMGQTRQIASLGISMTRFGRTVENTLGEFDQGQLDGSDDALGADVRGLLIRPEHRNQLLIDRGLGGFDEGLDLGVRARLGGGRLVLSPQAVVMVGPVGAAVPPTRVTRVAYGRRRAQLHRRLSYSPAAAVPLHWLSLLPLALWRTILSLVAKRPAEILPEWGAAARTLVSLGDVSTARRRIRQFSSSSWTSVAPLRVTGKELRRRLTTEDTPQRALGPELSFFSGGAAWAVLAALVVSLAAFTTLIAAPALGGGALLPLRDTVGGLWRDALWGFRGGSLDLSGPADPFSVVIAVLGSLWPGSPSVALVVLWIAALPLAVLGGWFAATRISDRAGVRIFGGIAWALAPTFLTALTDGRPASVLTHLLLPWLFYAGSVAHRSWGAAGVASILFVLVAACAPVLAPPLLLLVSVALIANAVNRRAHGAVRMLWVLIPTSIAFLPLVIWQLGSANPWGLLADPGLPVLPRSPLDPLALATGFPDLGIAGWTLFAPEVAAWIPLLLAPLMLAALLSVVARRWIAGVLLLAIALGGLATAVASLHIAVTAVDAVSVSIWPGTGMSLVWIGVVGGALVTLDSGVSGRRLRTLSTVVAASALVVLAVPGLSAVPRDALSDTSGASVVTAGPAHTLPAYVVAETQGDVDLGTLVLTPLDGAALAVDVVWGSTNSLGAQSTLITTERTVRDPRLAELSVDLLSGRDFDAALALADLHIGFVLINRHSDAETAETAHTRAQGAAAMSQRAGFIPVGETARGQLWRLEAMPVARGDAPHLDGGGRALAVGLWIVLAMSILLALPTRSSVRAARNRPHVVGRAGLEPPGRDAPLLRADSVSGTAIDGSIGRLEDDHGP